jgi:hypothetical protein
MPPEEGTPVTVAVAATQVPTETPTVSTKPFDPAEFAQYQRSTGSETPAETPAKAKEAASPAAQPDAATQRVPAVETPVAEQPAAQTPSAPPALTDEQRAQLEAYDAFRPLLEQFKQEGYENFEKFQSALREQERQAEEARWQQDAKARLAAYKESLDTQDPYGNLTDELKDKLVRAEAAQLQLARQQERYVRSEQDHQIRNLTSGESPALPKITPRLEQALRLYDPENIAPVAGIVKEYVDQRVADAVASYAAGKEKTQRFPAPETGRTDFVVPVKQEVDPAKMSWGDLLFNTRRRVAAA